MNTQLARSDLSVEDDQQKEINSSLISTQDLRDRFKNRLHIEQILPFLTNPSFYSFSIDLSEQLNKETAPFKESGTPPIVRLKTDPSVGDQFVSLQKWEGVVIEIKDETFLARLKDLTNEKNPEEEAEFPLEELSPEDRELVAPGAIFYWNIGYLDTRSGQRRRESIIRFRRLPAWSKREIENSKHEASRICDFINWK